ncbi:L-lactate dehydrogenase [Candidatus Saccharibacteria bacterium]|nr:L-lactate dehydrogenase [Candidatus Saccharibacteria bacterium]MBQ9016832.1 L-lactate dehydrogenase [Candidatus Saccharibacteria bacterium]
MSKVMVVGTGNVGASIAYCLINQRTAVSELILTDINKADAEGEAMDLRDTLAVSPSYLKIRAGDYREAKDCDIIIITAGIPQKPGESRMDLLKKNAAIFKDMIDEIMENGFSGIFVIVSNPMDVLTYLAQKYSGLPAERVIGSGTILDSARLRYKTAEKLGVHPKSVHAFQVGEHGDTEFALWSTASVAGQPITELLDQNTLSEIEDFARNEAYDIIEKKGSTHYGIGACVTKLINCILGDERRVLPVSSYDDFAGVYNGFPAIIGKEGIVRRVGVHLTEEEGIKMQKSINALKNAIKEIGE